MISQDIMSYHISLYVITYYYIFIDIIHRNPGCMLVWWWTCMSQTHLLVIYAKFSFNGYTQAPVFIHPSLVDRYVATRIICYCILLCSYILMQSYVILYINTFPYMIFYHYIVLSIIIHYYITWYDRIYSCIISYILCIII